MGGGDAERPLGHCLQSKLAMTSLGSREEYAALVHKQRDKLEIQACRDALGDSQEPFCAQRRFTGRRLPRLSNGQWPSFIKKSDTHDYFAATDKRLDSLPCFRCSVLLQPQSNSAPAQLNGSGGFPHLQPASVGHWKKNKVEGGIHFDFSLQVRK